MQRVTANECIECNMLGLKERKDMCMLNANNTVSCLSVTERSDIWVSDAEHKHKTKVGGEEKRYLLKCCPI